MNPINWLMLGILCAAPIAAAEPATQPSEPRPQRPRPEMMTRGDDDRGDLGRPDRDRADRRGGPRGNNPGGQREPWFPPLSEEEIDRAEAFMRENMPHTFAILEKIPDHARRRLPFPPRLQAGFRMMFDAEQKGDTAMQELLEKQFKLRDEFVGMRLANPGERPAVDPAMREKIKEIAQANLEQRKLRLQRMREQLKQEEERLEKEQQDPDAMIDKQLRSMWDESNWVRRAFERHGGEAPGGDPPQKPKD